ncbi:HAD-IA family hydrolase [Streptomyces chartreusis]
MAAAELLSTQPAHCIVVEDAPAGAHAARAAGMRCIGLRGALADAGALLSAHIDDLRCVHTERELAGLLLSFPAGLKPEQREKCGREGDG